MQLMVLGGVDSLKVIKACTSDSAKILKRENEFGSLQVGLSANIVLVEGDLAKNIDDTRRIHDVFMQGETG